MATREEIIQEIISHAILLRIGKRIILIIKQRTAKGIFLDGSSPNAGQYSTKPFAMPIGAIKKKALLNRIIKGKHDEEDETQLFTSKSGKMWVAIGKGYKWLREQSNKQSSNVDLRWTGQLMRSMTVNVNADKGIIAIFHTGKRNKQLAEWFNVKGIGKSKKLKKYLAISEEELQNLAETF